MSSYLISNILSYIHVFICIQQYLTPDIPRERSTVFPEFFTDSSLVPGAKKGSQINVIPIYCAILGAVVLALVVYVIVSQNKRMKQKRLRKEAQNGAIPGANETPLLLGGNNPATSPVGTQGSDSGVFMDHENRPGMKLRYNFPTQNVLSEPI